MLFPVAKQRLITRVLADRDSLERQGVRAALRFGATARMHAYAAWRTTRDVGAVKAAVRAVLLGSGKLGLAGMVPLVRDAMVAGHLQGHRRTAINVKEHVDGGVKLSTAYDGAIEFLSRRMNIGSGELAALSDTYDAAAMEVVRDSTTALEASLQRAVLDTTQQGGGVTEGLTALRKAFESEGFTPGADHELQAIFRTQVQQAYGAGRWQSLTDPDLGDLVKGFEYVSVHDERTRPTHEMMDGVRRPVNDEVWNRWWCPCGWNCRCSNLELIDDFEPTDVPDVQPDPGFGFNPGKVFAAAA
jgi:SPP1 gp7 family putative phage head morphogenesis protein